MNKYIKYAFIVNLVVNLTNLFAFFPAWIGLSLTAVGGLMLIVNFAFLGSELESVRRLFRSYMIWAICFLLLVWPIIAAVYPIFQGYRMTREIVLQVFYFTTLLGAVILVQNNGFNLMRRIVYTSFAISLFGIGLQFLFPAGFGAIAVLAENSGEDFASGRIAGFFINPNVTARFMVLFFLMLMISSRRISWAETLTLAVLTFAAVMLTASRSSVVLALMVFVLVFGQRFGAPYINGRMAINPARILLSIFMVCLGIVASLGALVFGANYVLDNAGVGATSNTAKRLEIVSGGVDNFWYTIQNEAMGRWYTVQPYVDGFLESWMFGRGLAGYRIYMKENFIGLTPHNTLFAMTLDFGVFYVALGLLCFAVIAFSARMRFAEARLGLFFMPIIFLACMVIMFTYDAFLYQRGLYVMAGAIISLYIVPQKWYFYSEQMANRPFFRKLSKHTR